MGHHQRQRCVSRLAADHGAELPDLAIYLLGISTGYGEVNARLYPPSRVLRVGRDRGTKVQVEALGGNRGRDVAFTSVILDNVTHPVNRHPLAWIPVRRHEEADAQDQRGEVGVARAT